MISVKKLAAMNAECFPGSDDWYSDESNLKSIINKDSIHIYTVKYRGKVAGYIICKEYVNHLEILRRGVLIAYRGKGLGERLARKTMRLANEVGKNIYTYVSTSNMPSLNSNIKNGYRVRFIEGEWVHIVYKVKKS